MKKLLLILATISFLVSCGPKRVCGGAGGKRCVEVSSRKISETFNKTT